MKEALNNRRVFYGYTIVAAAVAIQLIGWGTFGSFGVFINRWQTDFGWSRAAISGVASVVLVVHGLFSMVVGNLGDRLGPRAVMAACGAIYALGIFLTSRIGSLWQLYLFYGVVVGIGVSALDVVLLSTLARWFSARRGTMTGIVKAGAGLGHLLVPLLAGAMLVAQGWRNAYAALAVVNIFVLVFASQFLRRDPSAVGLVPYGTRAGTILPESGLSLREATRRWQFWSVVAVYFAILFCTYTVQVHIAAYAMDLGNSVTRAAGFLSIIGASSIMGRFGMGPVGDRFGVRRMMTVSCVMLCLTLVGLALVRQPWALYLIVPFYGFAHGSCYSLISPLVAGLFGTRSQGAIYGIVIFGGTIGGAIGPLLAGYVFDRSGIYSPSFAILSAVAVAGSLLLATLKPVRIEELSHGSK